MIPTDSIVIKLDKEAKRSGMILTPCMVKSPITWYLPERQTYAVQERADDAWNAGKYQLGTSVVHGYAGGSDNHLNLGNNFMQEGLAYRITPFNTTRLNARIDSEKNVR